MRQGLAQTQRLSMEETIALGTPTRLLLVTMGPVQVHFLFIKSARGSGTLLKLMVVHGGFCAWTDDPAGCPVTCGGLGLALLEQTRACDCPTPEHGGSNCTGDWARDVDCGTTTCPRE